MSENDLKRIKILIVDDEIDIIESIKLILNSDFIEYATTFDEAKLLIKHNYYDIAILDIMGVNGYKLLDIANHKNIPAIILTAHAFSKNDFYHSINNGAHAYIPKDKISELPIYIMDVLEAKKKGLGRIGKWFQRLEPFFEDKFGYYWTNKIKEDPEFWRDIY